MTFPRNAHDNSLDFAAFEKLSREEQGPILMQLRSENPDEFRQVMDWARASKAESEKRIAQMTVVKEVLDGRAKELDAQINTYTAAYRTEMANNSSVPNRAPELNNRNKKNTKCSIS